MINPSLQKRLIILAVFAIVAIGAAGLSYAQETEFTAAQIKIEFNSTDQDVGIQIFFDSDEPWKKVTIAAPNGKMFAVRGKGDLGNIGLTELFVESEEPEISELPLEDFLNMFPAGDYEFKGKTADGGKLTGIATLTHNIPDGPVITAPAPGAVVDPSSAVIEWETVNTPQGIEIVGYQ